MDAERFHQDQKIDPNELDLVAATQAETFFYWAEQLIRARWALDGAKRNLELEENALALRCRAKPNEFGLSKLTEAAIIAVVRTHQSYQDCWSAVLEAKQEVGLLDVAVQAMEQRKRMIEILVTLHGQQYFAGPSVPHDLVTAWQTYQSERSAGLGDAQRGKARRRLDNEKTK